MTKFTVKARVGADVFEYAVSAKSAQLAALAVLAKNRKAKILAVSPVEESAEVA